MWSIDASVSLFGLKFTILFIICVVLFLLLIPFNFTLLFTRFLSKFRIVNHFKPLLNAYQGSYKDKYHYWIGVDIISIRSLFFLNVCIRKKSQINSHNHDSCCLRYLLWVYLSIDKQIVNIKHLLLLINILFTVSY